MNKEDGAFIGLKFTEEITSSLESILGYEYATPDEVIISALNVYSSSYPVSNLVDGSTSTYWRGTTGAGNWILFQFSVAKIVSGFKWYTTTSYYPITFILSGSNDGTTFTQLGETLTRTVSGWEEFSVANTDSYLYYRIDILTAASTSRLYVYEIELYFAIGLEGAFTVTGHEYTYVPEGTLYETAYKVSSVIAHPTEEKALLLAIKSNNRFESVVGNLTLAYDSTFGNLAGLGGPVISFEVLFTPTDLIAKPDVNSPEHLEIAAISVAGSLIHIYYTDTKEDEHLEIAAITATGILTDIDDL